jgi:hypothetical protein
MAYITQYQYYDNGGNSPQDANWGSYQYVSLEDIVNNFMLMYQGNHELINNINRYQVLFFAKRAIQELNYDALKEIKVLELPVGSDLKIFLPSDYVNWVRISAEVNGVLFPLSENFQTNFATAYLQDQSGALLYDQNGNVLSPQYSDLDLGRINNTAPSLYVNPLSPYNGNYGWCIDDVWYFRWGIGGSYGLNTETANGNPVFKIDKQSGVINFSSNMSGLLCVIEYVSDGMENGNDGSVKINKLFEDYIYAAIKYAILNNRFGVQEYIVNRAKKDRRALLMNAKIRLSNIHPGRLLMNMRGRDKWIK